MSKSVDLLKALKDNIGNWTCAYCGSNSGQPAAIFREIKKQGYLFEEPIKGRWAKECFCNVCKTNRTHYKLLKPEPAFRGQERINIGHNRNRILRIFDSKDAITGASITTTAEIDHKVPWTRLIKDVDATRMSDLEIKKHFQLLTREHNLLKDRMCDKCKKTSVRPPFLGICYWYKGDMHYVNSCEGCGWYDAVKWRKKVNEALEK